MAVDRWRLDVREDASLPPMAWLLAAADRCARVAHGTGVRLFEAGIFEGTWVGEAGEHGPLRSAMPFGSGVLADGDALWVIPPGHMLEGVYVCRRSKGLLASNSLAGLLALADTELDDRADYPRLFNESVDGIARTDVPTRREPITAWFIDNLRLDADGELRAVAKPAEPPFASYAEYRDRLTAALRSALENAPPGLDPVVTISSGYDGAAVAALAAPLGCRRALTISEGKPIRESDSLADSGETVARRLGLDVGVYERLDYLRRDDLTEADFLATGFSGEEVVLSGAAADLRGSLLLSGFFGDGMWWMNRPRRPELWRSDQSGSSLGEWRLQVGFVHLPLPCFGARHYRSTQRISHSPEMRPWVLDRRYDKPIPRRILEEAGVPRGTFGEIKRAASATIHIDGPAAMAPSSVAALERFAAGEGRAVRFRPRRYPSLARRAAMKVARRAGLEPLAAWLERPKHALARHDPEFGSLVLRWAISVVRPRYEATAAALRQGEP